MYIPDLTQTSPQIVKIGYLEHGYEYLKGEVSLEFVKKLCDLLVNPCQPAISMGYDNCSFCRFTHTHRFDFDGHQVMMGNSDLYIPADGFLYQAPSLILHYMDAHEYAPPQEFQDAVLRCPPMRSIQYLKLILQHGPKEFFSSRQSS